MGLWDTVKGQLRSVIEWKDAPPDMLIWRWDGGGDELKNASKLIVGPGQNAIFVYEGEVRAIHTNQGLFELRTANDPFFTTLTKFMQGFESEHKTAIYFIRVTEFLNQKWGTKSPIKYDDPKYKFPVGLRAFGNFSFKITSPSEFFSNIVGNRAQYTIAEIRNVIVDRMMTPLTDLFAESGFSYAEIDKNRVELSEKLSKNIETVFATLGFVLTDFRIENTDFDEDTKRRIDKIADKIADAHAIRAMGDVDGNSMRNYATIEQLNALNKAAANPGGGAGLGVGMGAGVAMGHGMMGAFQNPPPAAPPAGATVKCAGCQQTMDENAKFCPGCGQPNTAGKALCVSCKKPMTQGAKFCPECGSPQSAKCPGCQADVAAGTKFCANCGHKF
jgi:membrane protease subunit (stomatin/prohibitin family)